MKLNKIAVGILLWYVLMLTVAGLFWLVGLDLLTGTIILFVLGTLALYCWLARINATADRLERSASLRRP